MISRRLQYEMAGRVVGPMLMALEGWKTGLGRRKGSAGEGPFGPPLECTRELKDLMGTYYYQGRYADGAVPVAWVASGFPVEVLRAHGFYTVYPENHGALCAARRMTPKLVQAAEDAGYSRDLCTYARSDIGSVITGRTPLGRVPKPDVVCACGNICQTIVYWFRALADYFEVPFVLIDAPFVYGDFKSHHLDYVKDQLGELGDVAESVSGRPVTEARIRTVFERACEASILWDECLATARRRPTPWTAFDQFIHMAPIVAIRGTEECTRYYRTLRDELEDRVRRGIGAVRDERRRLLWDNIAIWYKLRDLSRTFAENGFALVCATYTDAWAEMWRNFDASDRIASTARMVSGVLLNRDLPNRMRTMERLIRRYEVDGVVLHSNRSCKPYSVGQYDLKDRMAQELGVKVVVIEADHAEPEAYSAEQVSTRLGAFMESF